MTNRPERPRPTRRFAAGAGIALGISGALHVGIWGVQHGAAWCTGVLLGVAQSAVGFWLHRRAVGRETAGFLVWGLAGQLVRWLAVLAVVAALRATGPVAWAPVAAAVVTVYVVMMAAEIADLMQLNGECG